MSVLTNRRIWSKMVHTTLKCVLMLNSMKLLQLLSLTSISSVPVVKPPNELHHL